MIKTEIEPKILEDVNMHHKYEQRKIKTLPYYENSINTLIKELEERETTKPHTPHTPLTPEQKSLIKSKLEQKSKNFKESRESLDNLDSYGYSPSSCTSEDNLDIAGEAQEEKLHLQPLKKLSLTSN